MVNLPAGWKIARELKRILLHLKYLGRRFDIFFLGARIYDFKQSRSRSVLIGDLPASRKVAVYLMFSKDGVKPSHLQSIRNIAEAGYAPLVVSNLPLTESDQKLVLSVSWRLILRPNHGYDFGGYRDAMLYLKPKLPELQRLALLNDSTWFPVSQGQSWLKQAEELNLDFAAAVYHEGAVKNQPTDFCDWKWSLDTNRRYFHYSSFAVLFSPTLFNSKPFRDFWIQLITANNKLHTILFGEIRMTRMVLSNNFTHGCTAPLPKIPEIIQNIGNDRLAEALKNLITMDGRMQSYRDSVEAGADGTEAWRKDAIGVLMTTAVQSGAGYALADILINEMGYQFLKKSPVMLDAQSTLATLAISAKLQGEIGAQIRSEIEEMCAENERKH